MTEFEAKQGGAPLPDEGEVSLVQALSWVAYRSLAALEIALSRDPETLRQRTAHLASVHRKWVAENPDIGRDRWTSDNKDSALKLFASRRSLGPNGVSVLRAHLSYAKLDRAVEQRLKRAEAELLEAARNGKVRARGCINNLDPEASGIDPSYFDNPVAIDLLDGELGFDFSAPLELWLHRPEPDPLRRFRVRIEVKGLREQFPEIPPTVPAAPEDAESRFQGWAEELLAETGQAPTLEACQEWRKQFAGLSRDWMRTCRNEWPAYLRRRQGQKSG